MAVLAISSKNTENGGKVYYLIERQWIDSDCSVLLNPTIIFKANKSSFNQVNVIIHGKLADKESLGVKFKFLSLPKDKVNKEGILVYPEIYLDKEFVGLEKWEEGAKVDGTNAIWIGKHKVNIIPREQLVVKKNKKELKECSIIKIKRKKGNFSEGRFYLISFALLLKSPCPQDIFSRWFKTEMDHIIHWCTFKGVNGHDREKLVKYAKSFMPLITNIREEITKEDLERFKSVWPEKLCKNVESQLERNGIAVQKGFTSNLLLYIKESQKLEYNSLLEPHKRYRSFLPFSSDKLSSVLTSYLWTNKELCLPNEIFSSLDVAEPENEADPLILKIVTKKGKYLKLLGCLLALPSFFLAIFAIFFSEIFIESRLLHTVLIIISGFVIGMILWLKN